MAIFRDLKELSIAFVALKNAEVAKAKEEEALLKDGILIKEISDLEEADSLPFKP
jgi:hypothetical protein